MVFKINFLKILLVREILVNNIKHSSWDICFTSSRSSHETVKICQVADAAQRL